MTSTVAVIVAAGLIVDGGSVEQIAGALERLVSDEK